MARPGGPARPVGHGGPHLAGQWSDGRWKALLGSIADLVFAISKTGIVLDVHLPDNPTCPVTAENVVGKRVMDLLPVQVGQQAMHYLQKALRTGRTQIFSGPFQVSGQPRDFEVRITSSGPAEAVAVVRDVTARKLAEKEISLN